LIFAGHEAWLGLAGVLLAELFGATGAGIIPWWVRKSAGALERFGITFLAGLAATGLSLFGLALAGLLYPATIALLMAGTACSSVVAGHRPSLVWNALRELAELGRIRCMLLAAAAAPFAFFLAIPRMHCDAADYHMGAPAQFLGMHRILVDHVPFTYFLPMPVEMTWVIPLALGDIRLVSCIGLISLAGAFAVFLARERRESGNAWIGPLLALSISGIPNVFGGKNDVAASSFMVAGAVLWLGGKHGVAAALLGFGAAAKPVYAPFLLGWLLLLPPPRRAGIRVLAGFLVPFLPWAARSWLATGNPAYPFASGIFPAFNWDGANDAAFGHYVEPLILPPLSGPAGLLGYWREYLRAESPAILLFIPGLLIMRRNARIAWACVLGISLVLVMARLPRYCMPATMVLALLVGRESGRLIPGITTILPWSLSVIALLRIGLDPEMPRRDWNRAFMSYRAGIAEEFAVSADAAGILTRLGAKRYMNIGQTATYPLPGRALHGGAMGETPLAWKLAKESGSPARIAIRIRQMGADHLLYNFVSADWTAMRYQDAFPWDRRMLTVYKSWFKSGAVPAGHTASSDFIHGGFYVYRLLAVLPPRPARTVYYLPGIEPVYWDSLAMRASGRYDQSLKFFRRLAREHPDIASLATEAGFDCAMTGRWTESWALLRPAVASGWRHVRLPVYGLAALKLGRLEESRAYLHECLGVYLFVPTMIQLGLAEARLESARRAAVGGRSVEARAALAEAEAALVFDPAPGDENVPETRAGIRQRIGEIRAKYGISR
jgi:hypothetical protein